MSLPLHLDPSVPLLRSDIERLKPGTISRLRKNGRAHMGRARKINIARKELNKRLPMDLRRNMIEIQDFDPIEVYEAHNWTCPHCFRRVDVTKSGTHPDSCVLGHARNYAHDGGHTPENCAPWHRSCNAEAAALVEIPREAKIERLRRSHRGVKSDGSKVSKKDKTSLRSNPGWNNGPSKWPKGRKIQSNNNLRKRDR